MDRLGEILIAETGEGRSIQRYHGAVSNSVRGENYRVRVTTGKFLVTLTVLPLPAA